MPPAEDHQLFERTVPTRLKSILLSIAGFGFAIFALTLDVPTEPMRYLFIFLAGVAALFGSIFLIASIAPNAYLLGVASSADGFELRRPLRRPRFIRFDEIDRIEVVIGIDGERGDELAWRISSHSVTVRLAPYMVYGSPLLELLLARVPIDRAAPSAAARYEPRGLEQLWGKTFVIYYRSR